MSSWFCEAVMFELSLVCIGLIGSAFCGIDFVAIGGPLMVVLECRVMMGYGGICSVFLVRELTRVDSCFAMLKLG